MTDFYTPLVNATREKLASTSLYAKTATGEWVPVLVGSDGKLTVALAATPSIDIGDVTLLAGSAIIGKVGIDQTTPGTTNGVVALDSEKNIGQVGGRTPRVTATFTRLDEATVGAYSAGDNIDNSTTAGSVVLKTFSVARTPAAAVVSGRISGCRCTVEPASSNLVIANFDFDLLIFRPGTNIPFATAGFPADNAALAVSAAAMRDLVAVFSFVNSGWRSPAGSKSVAGVAGQQSVLIASGRAFAPFNLSDLGAATTLPYLLQAQGAWNPGHVNQRFDFALDVDLD